MGELWISDDRREMVLVADGRFDALEDGDLRRRRLRGQPAPNQSFHHNIVESRLEDIDFVAVDLDRCDWKDCRVDRATFTDCSLGHATLITNAFSDCRFIRCRFPDTSVSDCNFLDCSFEYCDFTTTIMKTSRYEDCRFVSCAVRNRLIESSLLLHTKWNGMELAFALITGNFGLRQTELTDCEIVTDFSSKKAVLPERSVPANLQLNPIESFRLAYFRSGDVGADSDALERALDLRNWSADAIIQASFGAQLSNFSQFLLAVYNFNEMPAYPLLLLHSRNFAFLDWLSARSELLQLYQVVAGIHLTLTREVDALVSCLAQIVAQLGVDAAVHLAANGPLEPYFYERWFVEQGLNGVQIVSVRPRNSPVELVVSFLNNSALIGTLALLLASRTKFELLRLGAATAGAQPSTMAETHSLIVFSAGLSKANPAEYELNVRTLLPRSLLLDLNVSFSVAVFQRARTVLAGLIKPGPGAPSLPHTPDPKGDPPRERSPSE